MQSSPSFFEPNLEEIITAMKMSLTKYQIDNIKHAIAEKFGVGNYDKDKSKFGKLIITRRGIVISDNYKDGMCLVNVNDKNFFIGYRNEIQRKEDDDV